MHDSLSDLSTELLGKVFVNLLIVPVFLPHLLLSSRFNRRSHLDILIISVRNIELLEVIIILKKLIGLLLTTFLGVLLLINDSLSHLALGIILLGVFAALWSQIFSCLLRHFVYNTLISNYIIFG